MDNNERIYKLIESSLKSVLNKKLSINPDTLLWDADGVLDSITFVKFVMELELQYFEKNARPLKLLTDDALLKKRSPFRKVEFLKNFILNEEKNNNK